jgi:hypothetical protein
MIASIRPAVAVLDLRADLRDRFAFPGKLARCEVPKLMAGQRPGSKLLAGGTERHLVAWSGSSQGRIGLLQFILFGVCP